MSEVAKLFDGHIINTANEEVDLNDEKYKGKIIGLYFSAHWYVDSEFFPFELFVFFLSRCPPCRGFTPILIDFYKAYANEKNFEILFISSDRDQKAFDDYIKDMPWLALSYSERKKKEELGKRFQISGIPTLVLLDGDTGEVLCKDARDRIQHKDLRGESFPWKSWAHYLILRTIFFGFFFLLDK